MRKLMMLIALLLGLTLLAPAMAEETAYTDMLASWADVPYGAQDIPVLLADYEAADLGLTEELIGDETALCWRTGLGAVTFKVNVPEKGLYNIGIRYAQLDSASGQIERGVMVNGAYPYAGCEAFLLNKQFQDAEYPFRTNEYGNEIRPHQNGVLTAQEALLMERSAMQAEPMLFLFEAGENTITLTGVKGSVAILGLTLKAPVSVPSYEEYIAQYTGEKAATATLTVEAENILHRSTKSIQNLTFQNPSVTPLEAGKKLLNAIGGASWDAAQDYVEWTVSVPETGLYCLGFNYSQSYNMALTSFRTLTIDGEVPFKEFEAVGFPFKSDWGCFVPGGENPYLVYLTEGAHTLRLSVTNAPYADAWNRLKAVVDEMKALDLYITEIIGSDSDVYRIWKLEKYIPTIAEDLSRMVSELEGVHAMLGEVIGSEKNLGTFDAAITDLRKLAADHNKIAKRSDALSSIYTTLSNWEDNMMSQPVALDKIMLAGSYDALPKTDTGFLKTLGYTFSSFISSFFAQDDMGAVADEDVVTVWVQRNRDYVDMMQLLADEYFTPATGIKVKVSYCPPGTQLLVLANAAGEQPDVVTGTDIALPFEFGIRNALVDLSKLEGFEDIVAHLPAGSRIPNHFSGAEYGIAEEIRVKVLFYRTDVCEALGIKVPETWDDMTKVLSTLLQQNYAFFYPYGDYLTFFFQNDVDVYTDDGLKLAFTNEEGYKAYRQWTELYVKYGLQPQMSSFYQHFRIGDVPMGIADIDQYIQFDMAAPDISGDWAVALIPGTYAEDGVLQRWQAGTQTCAVMFKTDAEREDRAWEFMKWWLSTDTQYLFAESMENNYGEEFRWFSANMDVVAKQNWPEDTKAVLLEQMKWYKQLPMVPGGSYMTSRELWNAWTRIVVDKGNYREEIETAIEDIELEIGIKQWEMGYIDEAGNPLIPMSLMKIDRPESKVEQSSTSDSHCLQWPSVASTRLYAGGWPESGKEDE